MYDIIILGAGPGGYELALEASKKGLSVALVEADEVGGTCLNYGCIPTKTYYQNAKFINELNKSEQLGITVQYSFDFNEVVNRKEKVVTSLKEGIKFLLTKAKVDFIQGYGCLVDSNHVVVNHTIYQAKYLVIATGSSSIELKLPGFDSQNVISSQQLLALKELPKRLVIIGGGVIGIEMASIFQSFGCDVTVIEMCEQILPTVDQEIAKRLQAYLKQQGIKIHTKSAVVGIEDHQEVIVKLLSKEKELLIPCDKVLLSVGRKPNVSNMGLDEVGITYSKKGILVNENFQTNVPNIYAIGDVTGKTMLAHMATYSGYRVLHHILQETDTIHFDLVPSCVFTFPEIASIGMTEEEAKEKGFNITIGKAYYRANGKAISMNETDGFIKIIACDEKIIGVHIIGYEASVMIHEALPLMNEKIEIARICDYIHAHPTLSEIFASALKELKK